MLNFTGWYFVLKHFKLQQFNIMSFHFFLSFLCPMWPWCLPLTLTTSNIDIKVITFLKIGLILPNKKRTPLISGKFFFHQQCPLIGKRTVYHFLLIIMLFFICGERKIWSNIKKFKNIMTMSVGIWWESFWP